MMRFIYSLPVIAVSVLANMTYVEPVVSADRTSPAVRKVTNTNDNGPGSLRNAIEQANANPGREVIVFDRQLRGEAITLTTGELLITDDLTIKGLGADQLVVSGGRNSRIFNIDDGDSNNQIEVVIFGLGITGGFVNTNGGGIRNV